MTKLVCGIGINDADYVIGGIIDGKWWHCPFYCKWKGMLQRCYSPKLQLRQPTYIGCTVDEQWHKFMTFRSWMIQQPWEGNQLDKDFLGSKVYSPETCLFIPGWLNSLFIDSGAARGDLPIGVNRNRGKYEARLSIGTGRQKHLGYFDTPGRAHKAYVDAKIKYVYSLFPEIEAVDQRLPSACVKKLYNLVNRGAYN